MQPKIVRHEGKCSYDDVGIRNLLAVELDIRNLTLIRSEEVTFLIIKKTAKEFLNKKIVPPSWLF